MSTTEQRRSESDNAARLQTEVSIEASAVNADQTPSSEQPPMSNMWRMITLAYDRITQRLHGNLCHYHRRRFRDQLATVTGEG